MTLWDKSLLPSLQLQSLAYGLHGVCEDATSAPLFLRGRSRAWLPWAFCGTSVLQCLILIRGRVVEYQGAGVSCWDQSFHFAWVSIISDFIVVYSRSCSFLLTNGTNYQPKKPFCLHCNCYLRLVWSAKQLSQFPQVLCLGLLPHSILQDLQSPD